MKFTQFSFGRKLLASLRASFLTLVLTITVLSAVSQALFFLLSPIDFKDRNILVSSPELTVLSIF